MRMPKFSALKSLSLYLFAALLVLCAPLAHAWAQDSIDTPSNQKLARDGVTSIGIGQQGVYFKLDNGKLRPVSQVNGLPSAPADGPAVDAFGRFRVSNSETVFQNKNIHSRNENRFEERLVGGGSSIAFNASNASADLTVGTGATDSAVRQSIRYIAYVPGKSQRIQQSFLFPEAKTGVNVEVGYGDDLNGVFFGRDGTDDPKWFVRSNVTGSPADTSVGQSSWNLDTLDGSGDDNNPSGILLDLTKVELSIIDFQWQGVGRVRGGLVIGGNIIYTHEFNHANLQSTIFMRTPTLPVRAKIYNTEVTASPTVLQEICIAVESEGGFTPPGLEFSALADPIGTNWRATSTTRTPIFAIRLVNTVNGLPNRKTIRFLDAGFAAAGNSAVFEVVHVHDPSAITATWTPVGGGSVVEWSEDITAITGNPSHIVDPQFVQAGTGSRPGEAGVEIGILNEHSLASQDFESDNSQVFVVYVTSITGVGTAWSHLTWLEFD